MSDVIIVFGGPQGSPGPDTASALASLGAQTGAAQIGVSGGGTVQSKITTLENSLADGTEGLDIDGNRIRIGSLVAPNHATGGTRVQGGAILDGTNIVFVGNAIAQVGNSDITVSTAFGLGNYQVANARIYGCDAWGFRTLERLADGIYVTGVGIDAGKDIEFGRGSTIVGGKTCLYTRDVRDSVIIGSSAGNGGGAISDSSIIGGSACDFTTAQNRTELRQAVIIGSYTFRNAQGTLFAAHVGNNAVQNPQYRGIFSAGIGHGHGQGVTTSNLWTALGYGSSSTVTTANGSTSVGALADSGNNSFATAIGYNVVCTAPHQIRIGGPSETVVVSNPVSVVCDARDKSDIRPCDFPEDVFLAIPVSSFHRNDRRRYEVLDHFTVEKQVDGDLAPETELTITRKFDEKAHAAATKAGKRRQYSAVAQDLFEVSKKYEIDIPGLRNFSFANAESPDEFDAMGEPLSDADHPLRGQDEWSLDPEGILWIGIHHLQNAIRRIADLEQKIAKIKALK